MQAEYDIEQLKIQEEQEITQQELETLKPMHEIIEYFIKRNYMHNNCGDVSKVLQLRTLLNVCNLTLIPSITYNAAYRAQLSDNIKVDPYVLFAWQKLCEKETEDIQIANNLDAELLENNLFNIKDFMFGNLNNGIKDLQKPFAECGIAFQV